MKKRHLYLLTALFALLAAGCAPVLLGLGAIGGYMISEDTLEGIYTFNKDEAFRISKNILLDWSTDVMEDEAQTELIATSDSRRVWVFVEQITPDSTRVRVKARKYGVKDLETVNTYAVPDIRTAHYIFERIVAPINIKEKPAPIAD
jgi:hypothetical protein